jgi:hypothetical protein
MSCKEAFSSMLDIDDQPHACPRGLKGLLSRESGFVFRMNGNSAAPVCPVNGIIHEPSSGLDDESLPVGHRDTAL